MGESPFDVCQRMQLFFGTVMRDRGGVPKKVKRVLLHLMFVPIAIVGLVWSLLLGFVYPTVFTLLKAHLLHARSHVRPLPQIPR